MADEVEALKARRKAIMKEIRGTFERSSDPHAKFRRASLTWQVDRLDLKIRQTRRDVRKASYHGQR